MIGGYPLEREGSPSVAGREASAPLPTLRCPFRTPLSVPQPSGETINHTWRDHYYRGRDSYLAVLLPTPSTRSPGLCRDPGQCLWVQRTVATPKRCAMGSSSQVPSIGER